METFINIIEDDGRIIVRYDPDYAGEEFADLEVHVDIKPDPTWPSPTETIDSVSQGVTRLMELAWERATGEPIDRPVTATRNLGHYEQMHVEKALRMVVEDNEGDYDLLASTVDTDVIDVILPLFGSHGTVAVTRTEG